MTTTSTTVPTTTTTTTITTPTNSITTLATATATMPPPKRKSSRMPKPSSKVTGKDPNEAARGKHKLMDVKLHVKCYAKHSPNNTCAASSTPFEISILENLHLERTTISSLKSKVEAAIESDQFQKKFKEYRVFDNGTGIVSWTGKRGKGNPKSSLNKLVSFEVSTDSQWKEHVKQCATKEKSGKTGFRYIIDVGIIMTKEIAVSTKRSSAAVAQSSGGGGQTAKRSKKAKTSPFRAPQKLKVNVMGPVYLNVDTAVMEVATKAVIESFEVNFKDFVFMRAHQPSDEDSGDSSDEAEPPACDEDDKLVRHTLGRLRNHVGSNIMQSKVCQVAYSGRVGKKVSVFCPCLFSESSTF